MEDNILVTQAAGPIATVVLNRPEKLNALTRPMWKRLGETFEQLSACESVRCIVIRGSGTKAFAPGNDISEFATERSNVEQARAYGEDMLPHTSTTRVSPASAPPSSPRPNRNFAVNRNLANTRRRIETAFQNHRSIIPAN